MLGQSRPVTQQPLLSFLSRLHCSDKYLGPSKVNVGFLSFNLCVVVVVVVVVVVAVVVACLCSALGAAALHAMLTAFPPSACL